MSASPSSSEEAVELFLALRRSGDTTDPFVFAARYPELGADLALALDALVSLERATQDQDDSALPERIGAFRIVREIGRGGMGVVLEAVEEPLERRVALKVLAPGLVPSASARTRFRREAALAARLDHPGIATVYGAGLDAGRSWIAMRFVEGRTLSRAIADAREAGRRCIDLAHERTSARQAALDVATIVAQIARALQFAHERGVLHRDVKPSNIIVALDGTPVLLDFGLATALEPDDGALTRTGETAGTPAYLPPENVSGERARPDVQGDVYALGVTLYECLTLRRPFDGPTPAALYQAILSGKTANLRALDADVPRDLAVVVETALERDRGRRYRSAAALADDLEACVAGRPIAARPVPWHGRFVRWARRETRLAAALAGAFVIAIGGLTWVALVQAAGHRAVADKNVELVATNASLATEKSRAESNARLATQRAEDVLSLSALQDLQDLVDRADELWPAEPARIADYEAWLRDAHALIDGRPADLAHDVKAKPGLTEHRRKLAELESRALPENTAASGHPRAEGLTALQAESTQSRVADSKRRDWTFADREDRWWHVQLTKLVHELEAFSDPKTGLLSPGTSPEHGYGVRKRLEIVHEIAERSLTSAAAKALWQDATAAIATSDKYGGLRLSAQFGLLPLGPDRDSHLWEFAHLATGEAATRNVDGRIVPKADDGLVLVLVPGGTFTMGAQRTDPLALNYDPHAGEAESPLTSVTLGPFFLSKYEMTQAQWQRFTGNTPSQYAADSGTHSEPDCSPLCPVETVSWNDCASTLRRLGLVLPTEAQWEYAARAGTHGPWWTGDAKESVSGACNLGDHYYKEHGGPTSWIYEDWLDDGWGAHATIGMYRPNAFGLHDVIGNVWEWCRDCISGYETAARAGDGERSDPDSHEHVCRGGGFDNIATDARSAIRFHGTPEFKIYDLGVRPARVIDAP